MPARPIPVAERAIDDRIRLPGSKSETIRALAAAALAAGRSHLYGGLSADDTMAMTGALHAFGIDVATSSEPWTVDGRGGWLDEPPGPIDCNESGLTARIVLAMAASLDGSTTLTGRGRLPERPMSGLVEALRRLGVEIDGVHLPIAVGGRGHLWGGTIEVDCSDSSQFATALMLVAPLMHEPCSLQVTGLTGSAGYLEVTAGTLRRFGVSVERTITGYEITNDGFRRADVVIEPDASAAVYPMAMAAIHGGRVVIEGLGRASAQPDVAVASVLESMGCVVQWRDGELEVDARQASLRGVDVDMSGAPDGAMAIAVVCLFAAGVSRISGLGSLRHKESDRLEALSAEMRNLGADIEVDEDSLTIRPTSLRGAILDAHGDHRVAMSMAVAGTRVDGVAISTPGVVGKTWPAFWDFIDEFCG